jgi:hypothetical protein
VRFRVFVKGPVGQRFHSGCNFQHTIESYHLSESTVKSENKLVYKVTPQTDSSDNPDRFSFFGAANGFFLAVGNLLCHNICGFLPEDSEEKGACRFYLHIGSFGPWLPPPGKTITSSALFQWFKNKQSVRSKGRPKYFLSWKE